MKRYRKRGPYRRQVSGPHPGFMGLALLLLVVSDLFVFGGYKEVLKVPGVLRSAHSSMPAPETFLNSEAYDYQVAQEMLEQEKIDAELAALEEQERELSLALETHGPEYLQLNLNVPQPEVIPNLDAIQPSSGVEDVPEIVELESLPEKSEPDVVALPHRKTMKVAIIIDDLGMGVRNSNAVIDLPAPLTLAFLPYAPQLGPITQRAKARGHELLIHVPMEPLNPDLNPGPLALVEGMSKGELDIVLEEVFNSFEGYVGINNHMGSRLTQNRQAMDWVMQELEKRDLIFVDSKTIPTSVALEYANAHNVYHAKRDVFLDHVDSRKFVLEALQKTEATARRNGFAIAIGHPKDNTIQALREWIPTLSGKNIEIVPVSELVQEPHPADDHIVQTDVPKSEVLDDEPDGIGIKLPDFGIGSGFSLRSPQVIPQ